MLRACHKNQLLARCDERGYKLEEILPCIIERRGDIWLVDTASIAYPHRRKLASSAAALYGHNRAQAIYVCDD